MGRPQKLSMLEVFSAVGNSPDTPGGLAVFICVALSRTGCGVTPVGGLSTSRARCV